MMHLFGPLRHLDLWSVAAFESNGSKSPSGSGGRNESKSDSQALTQKMGRDYTGITSKSPGVKDTVLMDLGVKEKTSGYYSALADRQARTSAMMESMTSGSDSDNKPKPAAAAASSAPSATTTATNEAAVTEQMENVSGAVGSVTSGDFTGTDTAGESEDLALEAGKKGRASTILTAPRGLLGVGDDEDKTRRRRSLIGG